MVQNSGQVSITLRGRHEMYLLSARIEERILREGYHGQLFSGFQRLSHFSARHPTYQRLSAQLDRVVVLAYPDAQPMPMPGIDFVPLSREDALLSEWFVIFRGADYLSALIAREYLHEDGSVDYESVWTFDEQVISKVVASLSSRLHGQDKPQS